MNIVLSGCILLALYMLIMLFITQFKGDTSIANFTWGGGVMLVALYTFFTMSSFLVRQVLITSMIVLWAARLSVYMYSRYTGKDPRFASWKWQGLKALSINSIWILGQAIMIAIMGYPVFKANTTFDVGFTYLNSVGILIWIIGFVLESISDYQLFIFMKNQRNKGHVMQSGLWRYSRHPNYFGEIMMWWGIFLVVVTLPDGWTTVIAPVTITMLILCITGIPMMERVLAKNPEYSDYKKRTSIFIPWFPKKVSS